MSKVEQRLQWRREKVRELSIKGRGQNITNIGDDVVLSTNLKLIRPLLQAYVKVHDARRLAQFTGGRIQ